MARARACAFVRLRVCISLHICLARSGRLLLTALRAVRQFFASPHSPILYVGTADGRLLSFRIVKRVTPDETSELDADRLLQVSLAEPGEPASVSHILPHPLDGTLVVLTVDRASGSLMLLSMVRGLVRCERIAAQPARVTAAVLSADGALLVTSDARGITRFWQVQSSTSQRAAALVLVREAVDETAAAEEAGPETLACTCVWLSPVCVLLGYDDGSLKLLSTRGTWQAALPPMHARGRELWQLSPPVPIHSSAWSFDEAPTPAQEQLAALAQFFAARPLGFAPSHVVLSLARGSPVMRVWPVRLDAASGEVLLPDLEPALRLDSVVLAGLVPRGLFVAPRSHAADAIAGVALTEDGLNAFELIARPVADVTAAAGAESHALAAPAAAPELAPPPPPPPGGDAPTTHAPQASAASMRAQFALAEWPPAVAAAPRPAAPARRGDVHGRLAQLSHRLDALQAELGATRLTASLFSAAVNADMARLTALVQRLAEQ